VREVPEFCQGECLKYGAGNVCLDQAPDYECGVTNEWWNCGEYDCSYECCTYGICSGAWCSTDYTYYRGYNIKCGAKNELTRGGNCQNCVDDFLPKLSYTKTTNAYPYINQGGSGGSAPPCAGLQTVISGITNGTLSGSGSDGDSGSTAELGSIGTSCGATKNGSNSDGDNGGSYTVTLNNGYAINNSNQKL
jgi:hypothetical protein